MTRSIAGFYIPNIGLSVAPLVFALASSWLLGERGSGSFTTCGSCRIVLLSPPPARLIVWVIFFWLAVAASISTLLRLRRTQFLALDIIFLLLGASLMASLSDPALVMTQALVTSTKVG
jgi:hypothetical protein